ncbi:TonB-dependent receptor [Ottowia thiooxydans]|uniref:TonB-dependent receptor n=1 Tax=Ottowia thiooxydans TaxID=219182 RepID=UPI000686E87A|nr:TonB-dependent receptor [Ottowia thiooxydans]
MSTTRSLGRRAVPAHATTNPEIEDIRTRPTVLAVALQGLLAGSLAVSAAAVPEQAHAQASGANSANATALPQSDTVKSFAISEGPLDIALDRFARAAGVNLSYDASLIAGLTTRGVNGNFGIRDGLVKLLEGSGIEALAQSGGGYSLRRNSRVASATVPAAATQERGLREVTITASAVRPSDLPEAYAGGQVARGSRIGMLGNMDFMDTPFSVASYTEQRIEDTQAKDIGSVISATDASVYVAQTRGIQESFLMRGFNVTAFDMTFNGLAGMAPYMRSSTEMAERVEVFKGPSAMLKGMPPNGTVGGGVNIVPKRAGEEPLTRLTTSYASDSQFGVHADVGRRFGENKQFGLRFNGVYRDGNTAVDDQKHKMTLGSLGLDWRGDRVRLSADIYRQRERLDGIDYFGLNSIATAVTRLPVPFRGDTNLAAPWLFNINTTTAAIARAEWDITDKITAYAAYGHRDANYDALIAQSSLLNDAGDISTSLIRQYSLAKLNSGEIGVQGQTTTGPVGHAWSVAATTYENKGGVRNIRNSTDPDFLRRLNLYNLQFGNIPNVSAFSTSDIPISSKNEMSSVALADRMSFLNDTVQLTLGVRHQSVKNTSISTTGVSTVSYDKSALSPSAALLFKVSPQFSVYGSYIQGLTQGSTAPATAANANEVLAPTKTKQYEIGAKYDFGRFAATAALFQISRPSTYTDPVTNIFAANGEQQNRGLELNVFGEAQRGLRLMGGLTYLDATLQKQLLGRNNGNQVTGVPKIVARLAAEYDVPGAPGLTLTGLINYASKRYATADNRLALSPYTTVNIGTRYATKVAGHAVVLRAGIDNLTNKAYWGGSWGGSGDSGLSGGLGAPRTFALSATVDF